MAKLLQVAVVAFGFSRVANLAAVMDDLVGEVDPAVLRDDFHQFLLDLWSGFAFGQAETSGYAEDVCVDDYSFGLFEGDAQDDVGGFASRAWDRDQFGERLGNLAMEVGKDFVSGAVDGFGLVVEEAGGADESFELRQGCFGHGRRSREALEEFRCDHVDADIGALCGEDGGDQQFPGRGVDEGALDGGIGFVEAFEKGGDAVGGKVASGGAGLGG